MFDLVQDGQDWPHSTITLALAVEPKDDVTISMASGYSYVDFSADELTFTRSNYDTAQSVTIYGVPDDIDLGNNVTDTVNFTVTSDDDCSNDDSCNQLASYDGYGVMSIDMVVVDDDFAHIILHGNASLSATIDNYGYNYTFFYLTHSDPLL